jgi:hypothetical protein
MDLHAPRRGDSGASAHDSAALGRGQESPRRPLAVRLRARLQAPGTPAGFHTILATKIVVVVIVVVPACNQRLPGRKLRQQ